MFVIADLHGSIFALKEFIFYFNSHNEQNPNDVQDTVFVCGDAGLEYGDHIQGQMKKEMKNTPYTWIIMRGNHDNRYHQDHQDWNVRDWCGTEVIYSEKYPNILYLSDTSGVFTYNGHECLFVPGGYSVDKYYRIMRGFPWVENEKLSFSEMNEAIRLSEQHKVDYVFSHVAPLKFEPNFKDLFLSGIDQSTVEKDMEVGLNQVLHNVLTKNPTAEWYFGHYHDDRSFKYNDMLATMVYRKFVIV